MVFQDSERNDVNTEVGTDAKDEDLGGTASDPDPL